ncbi:MAG: MBL fold metallo-hydrolase [Oscillospiraceae bacterium]|nr:MBL fold metallo-hydrolase [Oscillospiraceae bacterium]
MKTPNPATDFTARANAAWYDELPFDDESEKECALKGLIEAQDGLIIRDSEGNSVWSVADYKYMQEADKAPDTVNPSLWRNTLYNTYAGLFEVCDGIYQVRGYDMANATFIRTDHGWIVFDVMMCRENMAAAKALMEKHFGPLDVKAVLYSHSHIDHYGGVLGLINREDAADGSLSFEEQQASGKVMILAPEGFLKYAVSENIYAGMAMSRRAQYQYGTLLKTGCCGRMGIGIGLGQAVGQTGLVPPTYEICRNETLVIDGLEIRFQLTPGTEAPVEMHAYFPKYRGLWLAENCTCTMHNIYTPRGAQVRDPAAWANYVLEAEKLFGDETEVVFQSHNWPHWGRQTVKEYMENCAAIYQFIHDQTLHYINFGLVPAEISRLLRLPERLNRVWYTRQYYGTLSHNVKAVYQKYMGWYDANPVNLDPLTPEDTAKKWAEYLGDTEEVLKKARRDYEKGEYQWVAQLTRELVFADPGNTAARELCADALEQLGYQSESGPWRNIYLTGALELREGNQADRGVSAKGGIDNQIAMTPEMMLDYIRIRTDSIAAQNDDLTMNLIMADTGERFFLKRRAGIVLLYKDETRPEAECTVTCGKLQLLGVISGNKEAIASLSVKGDKAVILRLIKYMTPFSRTFNIVEP